MKAREGIPWKVDLIDHFPVVILRSKVKHVFFISLREVVESGFVHVGAKGGSDWKRKMSCVGCLMSDHVKIKIKHKCLIKKCKVQMVNHLF